MTHSGRWIFYRTLVEELKERTNYTLQIQITYTGHSSQKFCPIAATRHIKPNGQAAENDLDIDEKYFNRGRTK